MKSEKEKLAAKTVDQLKAAAKRLGGKLVTPDGKAKTKVQLINTIVMKQRLAGKSMGAKATTTKKVVAKKTVVKKAPARKTLSGAKEYNLSVEITQRGKKANKKIAINDTGALYVTIGKYTYYFDNTTNEAIVSKYLTSKYN
jgi:hypothetical protein